MITPRTATLLLLSSIALAAGCGDKVEQVQSIDPTPEVEPVYDRGYWLDMELDSQGRVWLAYKKNEQKNLAVSRGTGDPVEWKEWDVDGVPTYEGGIPTGGFDGGNYNSITIDSGDMPHVAHFDATNNALRYSKQDGDGWSSVQVEGDGVGQWNSIGIVGDKPIISYYDMDGKRLRVATVNDGGAWVQETVDSGELGEDAAAAGIEAPDVGQYTDLLVDETGVVWIAYYDVANGDLKLARGGPGNWDISTLAGEGVDVGQWPSLARNGTDTWVSFLDVTNKDLVLGQWSAGVLDTSVVDAGDFVGADSSLDFVDGSPVLVYQDGVNNDLKLARREGEAWITETILANGAVGFHNTVRVGSDGKLNWSCFDRSATNFVFDRQ